MTAANYDDALHFVWAPGHDNPRDGYHTSPNDPGGGTYGGVIETTWQRAVTAGIVSGRLADATLRDLSDVLHTLFWLPVCDALPPGVDLLHFNGLMMSGAYPRILQRCLGLIGDQVDGHIGPYTLALARAADPDTLINALTGVHYAYLTQLAIWPTFGAGWTKRLQGAQSAAIALAATALLPDRA